MANLLNIVKTPTLKKVSFPNLSKADTIVRKFIIYLANVRKHSNKSINSKDVATVIDQVYGRNALSVYHISDILSDMEGVGYDQAYVVTKFQNVFKKFTNAKELSLLDKQWLAKVEYGNRTRYILVVDDTEVKVKFSKELLNFYFKCDIRETSLFGILYSVVSYSALELIANAEYKNPGCDNFRGRFWIYDVAKYIKEAYEDIFAAALNASYSSLSNKTIAGVESDKIYQDEELNKNTKFLQLGFRKAEIDSEPYMGDKFNRSLFNKLENDWESICNLLPHSKKEPELKLRKLGKYRATGLYVPNLNILAVDIRYTTSFIHEYGHYLDFTYSDGIISETSDSFKDIRRLYTSNLNKLVCEGCKSEETTISEMALAVYKKMEYFNTPTEVFARAFECWVHFNISGTTDLTKSTDDYETKLEYKALMPYMNLVTAFFDTYFENFAQMQPLFVVNKVANMSRVASYKDVSPTNTGQQLTLF